MPNGVKVPALSNEIAAWVESFLIDCEIRELSPNTVRYYRADLAKFILFCQENGVHAIDSLTADALRGFMLWLKNDEGHNRGGVHAHYRIVKTFVYWWGVETDARDYTKIFKKVRPPKLNGAPLLPITNADVRAMLATCGKDWHSLRDKAVLLCLLDTGARANEFLSLDIEDVNMRTGAAYIREGKGNKARTVFIGKTARRALRQHIHTRSTGPLWAKQNGERLTYWGLRQMLRRRANQAGIEVPGCHDFRRAFCVNSLRAGMDMETLRRLMGHADYSTIMRYLALIDDDLQLAHAKTSPADRLNERR